VAWVQILFVLGCVGYSTYWLFQGNFEQAFLPYPILILYYLLFPRRKMKKIRPSKGEDANV
ncbi:MAG: hypothetical protein PVH78_03870, partial [Deltaproteobacteria bacterium]|jgi:hypothetical protein